jgi:hypothetical protein
VPGGDRILPGKRCRQTRQCVSVRVRVCVCAVRAVDDFGGRSIDRLMIGCLSRTHALAAAQMCSMFYHVRGASSRPTDQIVRVVYFLINKSSITQSSLCTVDERT